MNQLAYSIKLGILSIKCFFITENGQGVGILFRSYKFHGATLKVSIRYWTSALLRGLQKMAAPKPIS